MNEKLVLLIQEVEKNGELQEKLKGAGSIEDMYDITTQYVDGYTIEELKEGLRFLKSQIENELSDEDLENVAGGSKGIPKILENPPSWADFGKSVKEMFTLGL